jgi:hypothetical protein
MEDIVELSFDMKIFRHIISNEFKPFMSHQMSDIFNIFFFNQVIHTDNVMPQSNKKIAEMGAEKSRSSCNQSSFHFKPPTKIFSPPLLKRRTAGRVIFVIQKNEGAALLKNFLI